MENIDGKALAESIKDQLVKEILALGVHPNLAIILVGEREDSKLYVSLKEKQAKSVGIDTHLYRCDANITEGDLLATIDFLNNDESIDGILIQLPLPEGLDTDKIIARMNPEKDVDGFHPKSLQKLLSSCELEIEPPLIGVVLSILESIKMNLSGKNALALVNSPILGASIKHVLECRGAKVRLLTGAETNLKESTIEADLLISAIGRPKLVTAGMVKDGAVLIDVGITPTADGSVCGDIDYKAMSEKTGYVTPVPGGVGPMTIALAFKNTLELYKKRHLGN
ncbi:bifunctional 5,10-methylenetetrahydrofolate dehydrogenase/5,10-methenyltetrahydrofolate cyclohydrolase [Candidatus Falkowbacteria bacterium]|nr:bifunctional 5,10-methylenetetrahydrofolate dehydrogenase/5,10-methenyltetrahydrofolate cyclohydrolase [Candidatus Falkowbacteria bacterium]